MKKLYDNKFFPAAILFVAFLLQGCDSPKTFTNDVLAGETAVVGAGWKHYFSQDNITVTFTPDSGSPVTYLPGDPAIRGVINLYPDPLSSLVVSEQLNQEITTGSDDYFQFVNTFTNGTNEWWQTSVFLDTPPSLPLGNTTITITTPEGESTTSAVNVVGSGGVPDQFFWNGPSSSGTLTRDMFKAMERLDHYVVEVSGATLPEAIQVDLSSNLLTAVVKSRRGDVSSLAWNEDGSGNYRVIITPSSQGSITDISQFSFYVPIGGGVEGFTTLALNGPVQAFDSNGDTVAGVTASVSLVKGTGGLSVIQ